MESKAEGQRKTDTRGATGAARNVRARLRPWQIVERGFRRGRDLRLRVTLPKLKCLDESA